MNRESLEFDVLIVGAGPAGLTTAIRLADYAAKYDRTLSIAILEKGPSVGAHILSGAILEPSALNDLIPHWDTLDTPWHIPVQEESFLYLTQKKAHKLPLFSTLHNEGNFIISLSQWCEWLGQYAEARGINIFAGFPGSALLWNESQTRIIGIQTTDAGLDKEGNPTSRYQPGIQLFAKQVILAEGCRGSLSEQVIQHFDLRHGKSPQTYGIGVKELWTIDPAKHQAGSVLHTVGWPLRSTYGGGFLYHFEPPYVSLGIVVGLDYKNPYLDPFQELQRFKTHPHIRALLAGGKCVSYGARALNEGGLTALPKLSFPGGLLVGCAAGFLNVGKMKGIHAAMRSGLIAAQLLWNYFADDSTHAEITDFNDAFLHSDLYQELYHARNIRPSFRYGLWPGLALAGLDQFVLKGKAPWTFTLTADHTHFKRAKSAKPISYPKPDGVLTFDKTTQLFLSGTQHRENQPCHLTLKDPAIPVHYNLPLFDAPEQRYCPAQVYEIITQDEGPRIQINAQNCLHCKTCDIKDPSQNIVWGTPEGGGGPQYKLM